MVHVETRRLGQDSIPSQIIIVIEKFRREPNREILCQCQTSMTVGERVKKGLTLTRYTLNDGKVNCIGTHTHEDAR